jgi:Tfp pilus assembly protein PilF
VNVVTRFRREWRGGAISLALLAAVVAGCGERDDHQNAAAAPPAETEAQMMQRGVSLLYERGDPVGAESVFRDVLTRNPTHYGAQYQLAVSLDRGGKPSEARPIWEAVRRNAESSRDSATLRTARQRLAAPDTASQAAMMVLGLDLLYHRNDPTEAAAQFRRILQRNPKHYGATYQLAAALDRSGQAAEARPVWQKVLGMATAYRDEQTAATARKRLATP